MLKNFLDVGNFLIKIFGTQKIVIQFFCESEIWYLLISRLKGIGGGALQGGRRAVQSNSTQRISPGTTAE